MDHFRQDIIRSPSVKCSFDQALYCKCHYEKSDVRSIKYVALKVCIKDDSTTPTSNSIPMSEI